MARGAAGMTRHERVISCRARASWLRSREGACPGRRGTAGRLARPGEPAPRPGASSSSPGTLASHVKAAGERVSRAGPDRTAASPGGGSGPRRRAEVAVTGRAIRAGPARQEPGCALPPVQSVTHGHQLQGQTSCEFRAYRRFRAADSSARRVGDHTQIRQFCGRSAAWRGSERGFDTDNRRAARATGWLSHLDRGASAAGRQLSSATACPSITPELVSGC
jgi:hypothetical protein